MREFHEYMHNLHKARDREEFDRFMRDRRAPRDHHAEGDNDEQRQGY